MNINKLILTEGCPKQFTKKEVENLCEVISNAEDTIII